STSRAAITGRPPWPVPANTFRWISASGNRLACFARGTDVRDNNAVRADVQYRLNYGGIMRRHSHERGCRAFFCSHNVSLDRLQREGVVFHIDPNKIKYTAQCIGDGWVV